MFDINLEQERREFEAYAITNEGNCSDRDLVMREGEYKNQIVEAMWDSWLAAKRAAAGEAKVVAPDGKSVFLSNLHYFFAQTDGTYHWPAGSVGDLLRQAKREIEAAPVAPALPVADAKDEVLDEIIGCFHAAEVEGLSQAIAETTDERLKDLLNRRIMHAYAAAIAAKEPA